VEGESIYNNHQDITMSQKLSRMTKIIYG